MARCASLLAVFALGSCAPSPGGPPAPDGEQPTFVSLNPCLDAILVEVAAPEQILALSHFSRDQSSSPIPPDVAARFAITGGTAEEVVALRPDIVLASTFIAPATRAALERLGMRVETFGSPATLEESQTQVRELAALAGREEAGENLARAIGSSPAQPEPAPALYSALLWQPGQIVAGEATLVAENLRWAGLSSYAAERGLAQADYVALEAVLANPPDILLVAGESAGQTHPLLGHLEGTLVAEFSPRLFYCGGPSIPRARARLLEVRSQFEREFSSGPDQ